MTRRDEVIRIAREAGMEQLVNGQMCSDWRPEIERFADLVAAAKQEQCAKVAYAARDGFVGKSNKMACAADVILHEIRSLKDDSGSEGRAA